MARGISTGIEKQIATEAEASALEKQIAQQSKSWKEIRNRMDAILLSNNVMRTNELRQMCLQLEGMNHTERQEHIKQHWGPLYLNKVEPLLLQLQVLETEIAKAQESAASEAK